VQSGRTYAGPDLPRRRTIICCRNTRISASIAARGRIRSTTIPKISLQRFDIHRRSFDSAFYANRMEFTTGTANSEEKHEPVSDIDTEAVDGLKVLDPTGRLEKQT
jgi:hypothetical protein